MLEITDIDVEISLNCTLTILNVFKFDISKISVDGLSMKHTMEITAGKKGKSSKIKVIDTSDI